MKWSSDKCYGAQVQSVPRAENASDTLTHPVGESERKAGLLRMEYHIPEQCLDHPWPTCGDGQSIAVSRSWVGVLWP